MAACADGQGPPPPILQLAWLCGDNHLPDTGGIYDQDYATMKQISAANNIYRTVSRVRSMHGDEIHRLSDQERRIIKMLIDLGVM